MGDMNTVPTLAEPTLSYLAVTDISERFIKEHVDKAAKFEGDVENIGEYEKQMIWASSAFFLWDRLVFDDFYNHPNFQIDFKRLEMMTRFKSEKFSVNAPINEKAA
jgi:hypothetical protein